EHDRDRDDHEDAEERRQPAERSIRVLNGELNWIRALARGHGASHRASFWSGPARGRHADRPLRLARRITPSCFAGVNPVLHAYPVLASPRIRSPDSARPGPPSNTSLRLDD